MLSYEAMGQVTPAKLYTLYPNLHPRVKEAMGQATPAKPYTLYPIPYTPYPIPYTLYPIPYTPYPKPSSEEGHGACNTETLNPEP
jgi:hypothetical protein